MQKYVSGLRRAFRASSDALLVYEEARHRIAEAMGADPGPAPQALHRRVLRQDPALLAPAATAA